MKPFRWLLLFAFASPLMAQNVRWDLPLLTTQAQGGNLLPVYAIPGALVSFYAEPGGALASTYNSATSTSPCPTGAQVVLQNSAACVSSADPHGNMGAWFLPGQYMATIRALGKSYNYSFTIGGPGGVSQIVGGANVTISPSGGTGVVTINASNPGITAVSVATANGFQGTSSGGLTPALTLNVDSSHVLPVNTGSATLYLNKAGTYSTPSGGGGSSVEINGGSPQTTSNFNSLFPAPDSGVNLPFVTDGTNNAVQAPLATSDIFGIVKCGSGTSCSTPGVITVSGGSSGVTQIVAGTNVTVSPSGGTGAVTINASGGGGSSVRINGGSPQTASNFNSTTPAATAGGSVNLPFVTDGTNDVVRAPLGNSDVPGLLQCGVGTSCTDGVISVSGGGGGVTQIIAGSNVTISPSGGTGVVTINASGGGVSVTQKNCLTTSCAGGSVYGSGTTYTNSSGSPVMETVTMAGPGSGSAGCDFLLSTTVAGMTGPSASITNDSYGYQSVTFIVAPSATFSATVVEYSGGCAAPSISAWIEWTL